MLVLSLFPGIGLLDMAFEQEGFCVVRGPDVLWGGDVHSFRPPAGKFDGVIGGPPCQAFSRLRHIVEHNGYRVAPNLIPEYERCVREAKPAWFLMENVPAAPVPAVPGFHVQDLLFNNRWVGGVQNRVRRFSFGVDIMRGRLSAFVNIQAVVKAFESSLRAEDVGLEPAEWKPAVMASGGQRAVAVAVGGSGKRKSALSTYGYATARDLPEACRLQGLPPDFLADAPFTATGKMRVIGNGVPLPLGRAVARAVKTAMGNVFTCGEAP